MRLVERFWAGVTYAVHIFTFTSIDNIELDQKPLSAYEPDSLQLSTSGPVFQAPHGPPGFMCDYSNMENAADWQPCGPDKGKDCWLQHVKDPNKTIGITTDFEKFFPTGIKRQYHLNVTDAAKGTIAPDGFPVENAKVFNNQYPGPWIYACWGDEIEITIENHLRWNGTSIHWHGIRQNDTNLMDGVNGVTQCPIAPGDSFTYKFRATQYGTSWYHSHYSLQYADGLLGPLSIFGPSSAPYDEAKDPILLSDWGHRSAFQEFYVELLAPPNATAPVPTGLPQTNSVILNGRGKWMCNGIDQPPCLTPPETYSTTFSKGKKYLLRIINTSVDTTFVFAIDNHKLQVIEADFVPIVPYTNDSILVGIGQRYHVVVEANPVDQGHGVPADGNFWMRAVPADDCANFAGDVNEEVGIVRYNKDSKLSPKSERATFATKCSDETYSSLRPILEWNVGRPINPQGPSIFDAGLIQPSKDPAKPEPHGNLRRWSLGDHSLWLNFDTPTMGTPNKPAGTWDPELVVVNADYQEQDWVYIVITASGAPYRTTPRTLVPAAHPIHLHGHDFAILEQSEFPYWEHELNLNVTNPPRRDVVLVPRSGYIVIAFKSDNPGAWLLHCHIAWHASAGLGLQILERQTDLAQLYNVSDPNSRHYNDELGLQKTCATWRKWHNDANNWWNDAEFQDDSGI